MTRPETLDGQQIIPLSQMSWLRLYVFQSFAWNAREKYSRFSHREKHGSMKLSYYGYAIHDIGEDRYHLFDIRPFLSCFAQLADISFKNRFVREGENYFLLGVEQDFYLYLATRQNEVIKRINSANLDVVEINDLLNANERLGCASYVWLEKSYLAFTSTMMAPRSPSFARFVNDLFKEIGLDRYRFILYPFLECTSIETALSAPFLGRSEIKIQNNHSLFGHFANVLGADIQDFSDVDSIEVIIRPRPRSNIQRAMSKVLRLPGIEASEKIVCRGRLESLDDALIELHLAGRGHVSDELNNGSDQDILRQVREAIQRNNVLPQKVNDHEQTDAFTTDNLDDLALLGNVVEWPNRIRPV